MNKKSDKEQKIIETFTKRRLMVNALFYLALFCFAFIFTSRFIKDVSLTGLGNATEVGIAMGILTGSIIAAFFYWHCPACKKFLGFNTKIKACPKCNTVFLGGDKKQV